MLLIFQRETLRPAGIKVQQWRILVSLAQFDELHLRSLARHSSQDPAHTSRVVKSMIAQGWVISRPDDTDLRRIQFSLSQAGQDIVQASWPDAKDLAADTAQLFDDAEFQLFKQMLDRANAACDARLKTTN